MERQPGAAYRGRVPTSTHDARALARAPLRQPRPAVDIELSSRWDALEALGLVRRHAYLIQIGRSRWIVRVSTAGRTTTEVERDIEAIAAWARERVHVAHVVAGDRELEL
jgi:hypothetical protein